MELVVNIFTTATIIVMIAIILWVCINRLIYEFEKSDKTFWTWMTKGKDYE